MHDPYFVEENPNEGIHTQQKIRTEIESTGGIKESFSCTLYIFMVSEIFYSETY